MTGHYILDEQHNPVKVHGTPEEIYKQLFAWEMANPDALFLKKSYFGVNDCIEVSTVFLTVSSNPPEYGPPLLWETMIFGGPLDQHMDRYTSHKAAMCGHENMCRLVKGILENDKR